MRNGLLFGLLCLLSAAGCGDDEPEPAAKPPAFEDIAWVVADGSVRPSATFSSGRVAGFDGCNRYSASYESDGDSLTIGKIAATLIACPQPVDEVARKYRAALGKVARQRVVDGRLVLLDSGGAELLRYVEASPQGRWKVTSLQTGNALSSPIKGTELTADFAEGGELTGSGGCNSYSTTYAVDGDRMTIKPPTSTRKACPEPAGVMEQESAYLDVLETVARYELAGDQLTLLRSDGTTAASYVREAP